MLLMAVTDLQCEGYRIIDPRWHPPEDWDEWDEIPLPNQEEIETTHDMAFSDKLTEEQRDKAFYRSLRLVSARGRFQGKSPSDVVIFDPEYGLPNVLGIQIAELDYDNECLWALHAILADKHLIDDSAEPFFWELPHFEGGEEAFAAAKFWKIKQENPAFEIPEKHKKGIASYQRKMDRGWNYKGLYWETDIYGDIAMYLLHEILKMDITEQDLHLGLYWTWS